jgi:hypothetical protein
MKKIDLKLTKGQIEFSGDVPDGFPGTLLDTLKGVENPLVGEDGARGILFGAVYLLVQGYWEVDFEVEVSFQEGEGTRILRSGFTSRVT